MTHYTEVNFTIEPHVEAIAEALMSALEGIGYDGFAYSDTGFLAYIPTKQFDPEAIAKLELLEFFSDRYRITYNWKGLKDQDWNKTWEKSFTPIIVDCRIVVRAGFHDRIPGMKYDIVIDPKMSFGTGHHATTVLMLRAILQHASSFKDQRVLDMGCGTGILGIMASKAGAREVVGIDIDQWAYNNAMQNIRTNHRKCMRIKIGDASRLQQEVPFDIILANINRNILLNDMPRYVECLNPEGLLILSGFYEQDLPMIREKAESLGLRYHKYYEEKQWVAVMFYKN